MTYNRKKINTKGEKAPNGYHYMADDSPMSDEEHEKRYGKSFAHPTTRRCNGIGSDIADITPAQNGKSKTYQHWWKVCAQGSYPLYPPIVWQMANPQPSMVISWNQNPLNGAFPGNPQEAFYQHIISTVVDANTGSVGVPSLNIGDQISWHLTAFIFNTNNPGICLIPNTQSTDRACLIYQGYTTLPPNVPYLMFMTLPSNPIPMTYWINEFCCKPAITVPSGPVANGWDCEITAYSSTPPYAPIYSCVQKFTPQVGVFPTEQHCIASHCGPPPATISCSQCNNGSAVSSVFQGTTCPPGWQLASLGDPCKPPTGPTPADPIISG